MKTLTIAAGDLDKRVEVQDKVNERDASGGVIEQWATVARRWARIAPLRGRELFTAQAVDARITHKVCMRYYAGLNATMRIVYDGRVLNILTPPTTPDERRVLTEFLGMEDA